MPLAYSHFLSTLRGLQSYDLVSNSVEPHRTGGLIRRVEINFDAETVEAVAKAKL